MSILKMTKDSIDISIVVKDLERGSRFYGETLGLPAVREFALDAETAGRAGCASGAFRFRAFQAGEVQLKVLQAEADPPPGGGGIDAATGYRHITFSVESAGETAKALEAAGVPLRGEVTEVVPGRFILFFQDPDGNLIECVGPK